MPHTPAPTTDHWAIVSLLLARYGSLANNHAAGQLAAAIRGGNTELVGLWQSVLGQLRRA